MITTTAVEAIRRYDAPIREWVGIVLPAGTPDSLERFRAWSAVLSGEDLWEYITDGFGSYGLAVTMRIHAYAADLVAMISEWDRAGSLSGS